MDFLRIAYAFFIYYEFCHKFCHFMFKNVYGMLAVAPGRRDTLKSSNKHEAVLKEENS